jgi:hypothetical protein
MTKWQKIALSAVLIVLSADLFQSLATTCPGYKPRAERNNASRTESYCNGFEMLSYRALAVATGIIKHDDNDKVVVAVATVVIAIFTVVLGISTTKLWTSTENLVVGAEEVGKRQLRAYLGVAKIAFEITSNSAGYVPINPAIGGTIFPDFIAVTIRNYGETPAYNVALLGGTLHIQGLLQNPPPNFDFDGLLRGGVRQHNLRTHALINSQESEVIKIPIFNATQVWTAQSNQATLFIFGRIYYRDAYDRIWSTKFSYVWEPFHPPGARFVPSQTLNYEDQEPEPA